VRNRATSYFRGMSLPYPEPAIRLVRQDRVDEITASMSRFREELGEAVVNLILREF